MEISPDNMDNFELLEKLNKMDSTHRSLLSLDDMVLLKIVNHLYLCDIINIGETCKRLEYLTQKHFEIHYSTVRWRMNYGNSIKLCESSRLLKHIGRHVRTVNLESWSDLEFYKILVIIANECTHLKTLTLDSIRMNRPLSICDPLVEEMFNKLKTFVFRGCFWTGWCPLQIFFGENSTLEQLSLIDCLLCI